MSILAALQVSAPVVGGRVQLVPVGLAPDNTGCNFVHVAKQPFCRSLDCMGWLPPPGRPLPQLQWKHSLHHTHLMVARVVSEMPNFSASAAAKSAATTKRRAPQPSGRSPCRTADGMGLRRGGTLAKLPRHSLSL